MPGPTTVPHVHTQADSADNAPTRRRFLMGAAVAAAAAGATATAGRLAQTAQAPAAAAAPQAEPSDDGATGYRLTEHIRKYYKTTWI